MFLDILKMLLLLPKYKFSSMLSADELLTQLKGLDDWVVYDTFNCVDISSIDVMQWGSSAAAPRWPPFWHSAPVGGNKHTGHWLTAHW